MSALETAPSPEKFAGEPTRPGEAIFVVGLQYGDEGKGKIVDRLAAEAGAVARGNGGSNAGHTIETEEGLEVGLHQIPSGVKYPGKMNVIGHGVLVDPVRLRNEIADCRNKGIKISEENLAISGLAHMVLPKHKEQDARRESGKGAQGSTKAGISFAESDKRLREGLRVNTVLNSNVTELADLAYSSLRKEKTRRNFLGIMRPPTKKQARRLADEFAEAAMELKPYIKDTPALLNEKLKKGENILIEGAQAFGLDINHGKYPYVTSTGCTVPALIEGTGVNPNYAGRKIGVMKLTPSKVGGGTFVTKIRDEQVAEAVRGKKGTIDGEYGTTTGREREVGYLDLVQIKRAIEINGIDELVATKFDRLKDNGKITKVAVNYLRDIRDENGRIIDTESLDVPPSSDQELSQCRPDYKDFPTWDDDDSPEAERYLKFIENYLGVPITMVSNGPGRDQVFFRDVSSRNGNRP